MQNKEQKKKGKWERKNENQAWIIHSFSTYSTTKREIVCCAKIGSWKILCLNNIQSPARILKIPIHIYSLDFNIFAYCVDPWTLLNVSSKETPGNRKGIEMKISFAYSIWYDVYYSIIIFSSSDILIDIRRGLIDNWQTTWNEFLCYSAAPGFLKNRRTENDQSLLCYLDWKFHIFRSCCNNNVQ